jgi:hypothetical protein
LLCQDRYGHAHAIFGPPFSTASHSLAPDLRSRRVNWLENAPIWLIGLAIAAALTLAHEGGRRLGRRLRKSDERAAEVRGYLVSSALALLGLLIAFTFGAAQDRWRVRQELVIAEANAIGTTYLRAQLFEPPARDELSRGLLQYGDLRLRATEARTARQVEDNDRQVAALQQSLWMNVRGAMRSTPDPALKSTFLQSMNETFDLAEARRAAEEVRVPVTVLRVLILYLR